MPHATAPASGSTLASTSGAIAFGEDEQASKNRGYSRRTAGIYIAAVKIVLLLALVGCSSPSDPKATPDAPAQQAIDAPPTADPDASVDAPSTTAGFGTLGGTGCGAITDADMTGLDPRLIRVDFDFMREYVDPADRPLLTAGGLHLAETPNAGGSSGLSEIFAYEELDRCDHAMLLKTETEIMYDTMSKKTDLEIALRGHKIGVSVTRAFAYPLGTPYTMDQANTLIRKKLGDIPLATASVSAADRWEKQFLAIMAIDQQSADVMAAAWDALDATTKGDTIVILTTTTGADTFIYTNQ